MRTLTNTLILSWRCDHPDNTCMPEHQKPRLVSGIVLHAGAYSRLQVTLPRSLGTIRNHTPADSNSCGTVLQSTVSQHSMSAQNQHTYFKYSTSAQSQDQSSARRTSTHLVSTVSAHMHKAYVQRTEPTHIFSVQSQPTVSKRSITK